MPRKHKTPASSIQNRENQRRSRARHREFVENLQRRLREYERRGFEATLEMQQAARAIALENERLRELLSRRGISRDEVNAYLSSYGSVGGGESQNRPTNQLSARSKASKASKASEANEPAPDLPCSAVPDKVTGRVQEKQTLRRGTVEAPPLSPSPSNNYHLKDWHSHSERDSSVGGESNLIANSPTTSRSTQGRPSAEVNELPNSNRRDCVRISYICDDTPDQDHPQDVLPHVSDCYCPPESPVPDLSSAWTLETSCETAASIIAGVRGHNDTAQIRAALGCVGADDCQVRNTKLFQLMEEAS